jgi:HK97 family phage portal protein
MEKQKRDFKIEAGSIRSKEQRTIEATLSSTYPVKRYDGEEILLHDAGAVDLSREPLPLLCAHNDRTLPVGIVEGLKVGGEKLRGVLRFSRSADTIWQDVEDGILRNLSIGYVVKDKQKTKTGYTVTKWMPYEVSLVAAPADPTVGINRNFKQTKGSKAMDRNDVLKNKKRALDEMAELAVKAELSEDDEKKMNDLKAEIRSLDTRLEMMDAVDTGREDLAKKSKIFTPEIHEKQDRHIVAPEGGPAYDRTFAGMFNKGRKLEVNEEEIKRFRASMVEVVALWPLHPDRVTVEVDGRELVYTYQNDGQEKKYSMADIMHIRGLSSDGILGYSPLALLRDSFGHAKAISDYSANYFKNDASPGGILSTPSALSAQAVSNLRESWNQGYRGMGNKHKVAILDNDLKWQSVGVSPQDSQLIESQKFSVVEIARVFRVPLNLVMDYERSTYSNVTEQNRSFLTHTLQPWLERIEQAIYKSLLTESEKDRYFVEHLTQNFLKANTKERFEAYKIAREAGFLSVNEIRQLENMNSVEGGDSYGPSKANP